MDAEPTYQGYYSLAELRRMCEMGNSFYPDIVLSLIDALEAAQRPRRTLPGFAEITLTEEEARHLEEILERGKARPARPVKKVPEGKPSMLWSNSNRASNIAIFTAVLRAYWLAHPEQRLTDILRDAARALTDRWQERHFTQEYSVDGTDNFCPVYCVTDADDLPVLKALEALT